MMKTYEIIKGILTDREPGAGYFGGFEGAIRFVIFFILFGIGAAVYFLTA